MSKRQYTAPKTVPFSYPALNVWAAAAMVYRINGGYLKEAVYDYNPETNETQLIKEPNKKLVKAVMLVGEGWTQEDIQTAEECRAYWQGGVMKLLSDAKISDFEKQAIKLAEKEEITTAFDVAVISSLIGAAKRGAVRDEIEYAKRVTPGEWLGKANDKIHLDNLIVLTSNYSINYGSYRNEGTQNGNYVSWWGKEKLTPGAVLNVTARVKANATDAKTGAKITQINYVKEAK